MELIVKKLKTCNHVYLFDDTLRPLSIEIKDFNETEPFLAEQIKRYSEVKKISFVKKINFNKNYS